MSIELQLQMGLYDWFELILHQHQLSPANAQRYFWGWYFHFMAALSPLQPPARCLPICTPNMQGSQQRTACPVLLPQ